MRPYFLSNSKNSIYRILLTLIITVLTVGLIVPPSFAQLDLNLPEAKKIKPVSPAYQPVVLKAVTVNPKDPFLFDFLIDKGDTNLEGEALEAETQKLVKYFLAAVTIPEKDLWVNLSPYEQDAMIPQALGITELGKDLLVDDYILKQVTAGLTNPNTESGKQFWAKAYQKAQELYGTTQIPINTFSKVWIVPDHAEILEKDGSAFVASSHLKVYLDEDYIAVKNNLNNKDIGTDKLAADKTQNINNLSTEIIREVVLPIIEKEINNGKNFALVRQIYSSAILAAWYKKRLKDSILGQLYADQGKIAGVNSDDFTVGEKIYDHYTQALKTGVYNIIKQDYDLSSQKIMQRKYFSGGVKMAPTASTQIVDVTVPEQMRTLSPVAQQAVRAASSAMATGDNRKYVTARVQVANASSSIREAVQNALRQQGSTSSSSSALAEIIKTGLSSPTKISSTPIADRPEVSYGLTVLKDPKVEASRLIASFSFQDATVVSREIEALKSAKSVVPGDLQRLAPRTTELLATNPQFLQSVMEQNDDLQDMRVWTQLVSIPKATLDDRLGNGDLKGLKYEEKRTIQLAHRAIQDLQAERRGDTSRILSVVSTISPDITIALTRVMNSAFKGEDGKTTTLAKRMLSDLDRPRTSVQTRVNSTIKSIPADITATEMFIRDEIPPQDRNQAYRELKAISDLGPQAQIVDIARVAPTLVNYVSQPSVADDLARALTINTTVLDQAQPLVGLATAIPNNLDLDLQHQGFSANVVRELTAAQIALKKAVQERPQLLTQPEALVKAADQAMKVFEENPTLREYYTNQSTEHRVLETFVNLAQMSEDELNQRLTQLNLRAEDRRVVDNVRREIESGIADDPSFAGHPELKSNPLIIAKFVSQPAAQALTVMTATRPEVSRAIVQPTLPMVAATQQLAAYRLITDSTEEQFYDLVEKMIYRYKVDVEPAEIRAILREKTMITTDHAQYPIFDKAYFAPTIMAFVSNRERAQQLLSVSTASAPTITAMDRVLGIQGFRQFSTGQMTDHLLNMGIAAENASQVAAAIRQVGEKPNAINVILNPITLAAEVSKTLESQGISGPIANGYANQIASGSFLMGLATAHESSLLQRNALADRQLTEAQISQAIQEKGNVNNEDASRLVAEIKSIQVENSALFRDAAALAQQHPMVNSLIDRGTFDQVARQGQTPQALLEAVGAQTIAEVMVNALSEQERGRVGLQTLRPSIDTAATKKAYDTKMRQLVRDVKKVVAEPAILSNIERLASLPVFSEIYHSPSVRKMFSEMLGPRSGDRQDKGGGISTASSGINYFRGIFAPNVTEERMRASIEGTLKSSKNFRSNVDRGFLADDLVRIKQEARDNEAFALKIAAVNNIAELQAVVSEAKIPVSPQFNKLTDSDVKKLGGIDLSAERMDLQIKRDGNGVPLDFPLQDVGNLKIEGLAPVILDMQPATPQNASFLMNLAAGKKQ